MRRSCANIFKGVKTKKRLVSARATKHMKDNSPKKLMITLGIGEDAETNGSNGSVYCRTNSEKANTAVSNNPVQQYHHLNLRNYD